MLKNISLFVFLFCCTTHYSQSVSGVVLSEADVPIPNAMVQLLKNNSVVTYARANFEGFFELEVKQKGEYTLIINHWEYQKLTQTLSVPQTGLKNLIFHLEKKIVELGEVVIQAKTQFAKRKGDTLSYNLEVITDGNERKLKDILNKLPGVEVDVNGKIKANGKQVDDLLINGQKLFGDNHRIATENINAEMLDEIELINNYESFSAIKEVEGSDRTAMNINIKEEYFGKITGNADIFGAYRNKYHLHSNMFQFNKKFSLSLIADANNIGKESMSIFEFIELNSGIKSDVRNNQTSGIISGNSLPSYLLKGNDVAKKNNQFLSLNTVFQALDNWSITGYAIGNRVKTNENKMSRKYFYDGNTNLQDALKSEMDNFNIQSKINSDYYFGRTALLNYTFSLSKNKTEREELIHNKLNSNILYYNENRNPNDWTLGQQMSYIRKITRLSLLSLNAYHEIKSNDSPLFITSNTPLFGGSDNSFSQEINEKNNEFGFFVKYTRKLKKNILTVNFGYNNLQQKLRIFNTLKSSDEIRRDYIFSNMGLSKKKGIFEYRLYAEVRKYLNTNRLFFIPQMKLKYHFKKEMHYLEGGYKREIKFPNLNNLNKIEYVSGIRSFNKISRLSRNTELVQDVFSLNYFYMNLYHGITIIGGSFYTLYDDIVAQNNVFSNDVNYSEFRRAEGGFSWTNYGKFDYRWSEIRHRLSFNGDYNIMETPFYANNILDKNINRQYSSTFTIASNFKHRFFNYEMGISYKNVENEIQSISSKTILYQWSPLVNFTLNIGRYLTANLNHSYNFSKTGSVKNSFLDMSYRLTYEKDNSKFKYFISAENFLYLNGNEILTTFNGGNYFATQSIQRLSGFIGGGITFDF